MPKLLQLTEDEYRRIKTAYTAENESHGISYLCHVGVDAGLYSELCAMMEAMLYCHKKGYRFVLYADDANFSGGGKGWEEFFIPFCEMDHHVLNQKFNRRYPRNHALSRLIEKPFHFILKKQSDCNYLTTERFFHYIMNEEYLQTGADWELFGLDGPIHYEYTKIKPFALRYNEDTAQEIQQYMDESCVPERFLSVQIRGGDKVMEETDLFSPEEVAENIRGAQSDCKEIFLFTDVYQNYLRLQELLPEYRIYTLAEETDGGYTNADFQQVPWESKRRKIVRLFAMVELCMLSELHFGDWHTSPNALFRGIKGSKGYVDLRHT